MNRGDLTLEQCELALEDFRSRLEDAFVETQAQEPAPGRLVRARGRARRSRQRRHRRAARRARHDRRRAGDVPGRLHAAPEARTHPRRTAAASSTTTASTGRSPRASRSARCCTKARPCASRARTRGAARSASGTRLLVDHETEAEYTPLAHLPDAQAPFMIYDSVLSEFAALGFEYGYSVADRDALVAWEAQFGDFMNGAQIDHRPVHRRGRGQVGPAQRARAAAPPRLGRPGPRALLGPARALPRAVRRGQHPRRLPVDRRAVLPRAAPPGARPRAQAARSC